MTRYKIIVRSGKSDFVKDLCEKSFKYFNFFKTLDLDNTNQKNLSINSKNIDSIFENVFAQIEFEKKKQLKNIMKWKLFFQIVLILKKDLTPPL